MRAFDQLSTLQFASATSHSHRGFSPVTTLIDMDFEPFQRFTRSLLPSKQFKPLKRLDERGRPSHHRAEATV